MVPHSGDMYKGYNSERRTDDPRFSNKDHSFYAPDRSRGRQVPVGVDNSRSYISSHQNSVLSSRHRSQSPRQKPPLNNDEGDENGFRDHSRLDTVRYRSRSQPSERRIRGPSYPVPERPRSHGHSMYSDSPNDVTFQDSMARYEPRSFHPPSHQQYPTSQTSLLSPVESRHPRQPFQSYNANDDDDDDEEVFMPPPISSVFPIKPGFPRHSSMKPGAHQTYLTDDFNESGQPFTANELSSVLPSPFSDSHIRGPYRPYQRQYPSDVSDQRVPYSSQSRTFDYSKNSSYGDMDSTVVARRHSPERSMSKTLIAQNDSASSDSSGRPVGYTRDQLLGVVDRVRKGPRAAKKGHARGSRGSHSELDSVSASPTPGHIQGSQVPESVQKPSVIVRDRPSKSYPYEFDPLHRYSGSESRASVNSSGQSSCLGRGRVGPSVGGDSRSYARDDLTPDSISSGIGSRNTSSQLTGSSLHSRPSRLGSNLTAHDQDVSNDSAFPLLDYPQPFRKDISGDENYEFDSYNAVESDLLEALKNYKEVNNDSGELMSALQEGLNTAGLLAELYPKPSRQSRYSDSEKRFEKLRGEFQQYRQKQKMEDSFPRNSVHGSGDSEYYNFPGHRDGSQHGSVGYGYPGYGNHYYSGRGDNSVYKAGPMDSDML